MRALVTIGAALCCGGPAAAQSTGYPACDKFIGMVNECVQKMPGSERANRQGEIDAFRQALTMFGATMAGKCEENIRLEMQRDRYGCYGAQAAAAGIKTACTLVTEAELSSIIGVPYAPGTAGHSKCMYAPRTNEPRPITIAVAWSKGREEMAAWRAAVAKVKRELSKSTSTPPVEGETLTGLGDDAFFVMAGFMPMLAVRQGDVAVSVEAPATREELMAIARKALERLR